ncbi:MAG: integrase, partial [Clostridia bacterium]
MSDYYKQREISNNVKLKKILIELPLFCFDFFIGIENTTSILTRLNYAYDLRVFFDYLIANNDKFKGVRVKTFSVNMLEQVTVSDIELFLNYVSYYENGSKEIVNHERGKARKLSTIRSFFKYYFNKGDIASNVSTKISMPKIHDKEIVRLDVDEVVKILDEAENGDHLTSREKA